MTKAQLTFAPGAVEDARDARLHYRDINARLANDFMAKLDLAIERIAENPAAWPRWSNDVHRYFMQRFPMRLFIAYDRMLFWCSRSRIFTGGRTIGRAGKVAESKMAAGLASKRRESPASLAKV